MLNRYLSGRSDVKKSKQTGHANKYRVTYRRLPELYRYVHLTDRGPGRSRPPSHYRECPHVCWTLRSAGKGRAGSSALLRSDASVPGALRRLLLLPHLEAGEQLNQPDVPLLRQEQEEEAQADDDDGDDPDPIEDDRAGVVIDHCGHKKMDG